RLHRAPIPYTLEGESRLLDDTSPAAIVYDSATAAPAGIGDVPAMVRAALRGDSDTLVGAARQLGPMSGSATVQDAQAGQEKQPVNPNQDAAVLCNDYPTLWDRTAPVAIRLRQFAAAR